MSDLARRLAEHPLFDWRPGMSVSCLSVDSRHPVTGILMGGDDPDEVCVAEGDTPWSVDARTLVPNLDDPGTRGHLLDLLREAMGSGYLCAYAYVAPYWVDGFPWAVIDSEGSVHNAIQGEIHSEGQALAAALLNAWGDA